MQLWIRAFVIIKQIVAMKRLKIYKKHIVLAGIISLLCVSCDDFFNCLDGNGIIKTEQRIVSEFFGVVNNTSFNVDVVYDPEYSVSVTADENLLSYINTKVRDGNLIIEVENDRCIEDDGNIFIDISMPSIDLVELNASGSVDVEDFDCRFVEVSNSGSGRIDFYGLVSTSTVEIILSGSGDITLLGKAHTGDYTLAGSGSIHADDFKVDDCYATNAGSGNIYCFAYDLLNATIAGSGDIIYSGSPVEVEITDNGSGRVYDRNY